MSGEVSRKLQAALLSATLAAGLAGCQSTAPAKPQVQAALPAPGMDTDIQRILTAGGLNASAPGQLHTKKMPPDVQQAVAALQGDPAPAATQVASAGAPGQAVPASEAPIPSAAGSTGLLPPLPPLIAQPPVLPGKAGRNARGATRLASVQTRNVQAALAPAGTGSIATQDETPPGGIGVSAYLPTPMPQMRTVMITGPGSAPRRETRERVAAPAPRLQAAVAAPRPAPVVAVPEPEAPRIRRF